MSRVYTLMQAIISCLIVKKSGALTSGTTPFYTAEMFLIALYCDFYSVKLCSSFRVHA